MNTTTTPPVQEDKTRKIIFDYDEKKFAKTISRLTKDLISEVKIAVWALIPNSDGKCINLLDCALSSEDFETASKHAIYTVYEGSALALRELGVA